MVKPILLEGLQETHVLEAMGEGRSLVGIPPQTLTGEALVLHARHSNCGSSESPP